MADIIMHLILSAIKSDYPEIRFEVGDRFYWSPSLKTIFYTIDQDGSLDEVQLIHELAHAVLGHNSYEKDVELLQLEVQAWEMTRQLMTKYELLSVSKSEIESALDSYRDWLHARSICPTCRAIGYEVNDKVYRCVACETQWRPNEARTCGLKRYKITP